MVGPTNPGFIDNLKRILLTPPDKSKLWGPIKESLPPKIQEKIPTPTPNPPIQETNPITNIWDKLTEIPDKTKLWDTILSMGWDLCLVVVMIGFLGRTAGFREGNKLIALGVIGAMVSAAIRVTYGR
jgi:hypothetical protein